MTQNATTVAAYHQHHDALAALLRAGANVNLGKKDGWNCAIYAAHNGDLDMLRMVTEAGADLDYQADGDGFSLLHAAVSHRWHTMNGKCRVARALLIAGVSTELLDCRGGKPDRLFNADQRVRFDALIAEAASVRDSVCFGLGSG